MATTTNYVQLPPDGVGKKIRHRLITDIVTNVVSVTPALNTTLYGSVSGAIGILVGTYNAPDGSVSWYISVTSGTFTTSDSLYSAASGSGTLYTSISAVAAATYEPVLSISDSKVPEYTLAIDQKGAASTRFFEGTPQFDAWGHMQMSQMLAVGEYYHFVQDLASKYATTTSGTNTGLVMHNPSTSSMVYYTDLQNGSYAKRQTGQYHPYKPGVSQLMYTSIAISDGAKANLVREWGYFDDNNGFGFRLDGTTMKVFLRTDASGTPVDTEVTQANWNQNTLLSATTSDFLLDITKSNLYWMDVQGTIGRIRLGVETPDGRRITVHEFRPTNNFTGPSCRNLSLPCTWAQRNTGVVASAATGGGNVFRVGAGVVFTESADVKYSGILVHIIPEDPVKVPDDLNYHPFLQFKAKNTVDGVSQGPSYTTANPISVMPLVVGKSYTIDSVGGTDWTSVGANSNTVGVQFVATGTGTSLTGTGYVHQNIQNSIIGIHETFDWASENNQNLAIGIFVFPNERWLNNIVWSSSIEAGTMLYVDKTATDTAQYKYWDTAATSITGNFTGATGILAVSSVTGSLVKEMYVTAPPLYASGPLFINGVATYASTTGSVAPRTRIVKQMTGGATGTQVAAPTYGTQTGGAGVAGSTYLVVSSATGIAPGQLVNGTNLPQGTFVESISGTTVLLSQAFTGTGSGTYYFYTPGGAGTYLTSVNFNTGSTANLGATGATGTISGYGGYYFMRPIESFVAPANGSGRAALGDRIEKSFGLGPALAAAEDGKGVFSFQAKCLSGAATGGATGATGILHYTKYWKEIR
jgi:hypothetical protein